MRRFRRWIVEILGTVETIGTIGTVGTVGTLGKLKIRTLSRTARRIRAGSSMNDASGGEIVRSSRRSQSSSPPT